MSGALINLSFLHDLQMVLLGAAIGIWATAFGFVLLVLITR